MSGFNPNIQRPANFRAHHLLKDRHGGEHGSSRRSSTASDSRVEIADPTQTGERG